MWVRSLPSESFSMDHMIDQMLLFSSFCFGVGRASLLGGGGSISLIQKKHVKHSRWFAIDNSNGNISIKCLQAFLQRHLCSAAPSTFAGYACILLRHAYSMEITVMEHKSEPWPTDFLATRCKLVTMSMQTVLNVQMAAAAQLLLLQPIANNCGL